MTAMLTLRVIVYTIFFLLTIGLFLVERYGQVLFKSSSLEK